MIPTILVIAALLVSLWNAWRITDICTILVKNDLLDSEPEE